MTSKIYCGDSSILPISHDRFGSRNECLKCGFGASMFKYRWAPADTGPKPPPRAREGCLRPRLNKKGKVMGNQFGGSGLTERSSAASRLGSGSTRRERVNARRITEARQRLSKANADLEAARKRRYPDDDNLTFSPREGRGRCFLIIGIIHIIVIIVTFILLWKFPPKFLLKKQKKKNVIDWKKFTGFYLILVVSLAIVVAIVRLLLKRATRH